MSTAQILSSPLFTCLLREQLLLLLAIRHTNIYTYVSDYDFSLSSVISLTKHICVYVCVLLQASTPTVGVITRVAPSRVKQSLTNPVLSNGKSSSISKDRPGTAPISSTKTSTITPLRIQRPVALLPSPPTQSSTTKTKTQSKPVTSNVRCPSFSPTSNLQRQSTSTGGSTSSISSTNTQGSIPCVRSDTPTSNVTVTHSTTTIVHSSSNEILTPSTHTKSRIPVRAISTTMIKKPST